MRHAASIRIYLAGPLFTQAEWQWNQRLKEELESRGVSVLLPQERAEPMLAGKENFDPTILFKENLAGIGKAKAVVAIFDGADVDSGTAWECGYAYKLGRPVIGVRTDIRAGGDDPKAAINLMLSLCCYRTLMIPGECRADAEWVASRIVDALKEALGRKGHRSGGRK
jgi:nucleoside 2-deoxyribosyltransferase